MRTAAALVFLLALTVAWYWKLTLSRDYTWLENPDQAFQVRPWLDFEARELHAGRLPLWDPYHWGGQSLIGQVQPGLANPLNWILFAMPLRGGHIPLGVLDWYWVLIHWVAAAFCYWLCRDLGAGHGAAILGASIFTFAGFIGHAGTPQFLMSALCAPLVFLFFARVFRGQRTLASAALCGASLGAAFLSGHHNVPLYTAVLLGALWLWFIVGQAGCPLGPPANRDRPHPSRDRPHPSRDRPHPSRDRPNPSRDCPNPSRDRKGAVLTNRLLPLLVFVVICGLVAALQLLPAIELGQRAVRWAGAPQPQHWGDKIPYSVHAEYSLRARSLPGMVLPGWPAHANPFVGIVAMALALSATALRWRSREVRLMAAVAVGGLLLALGSDTPVHRILYDWIPMVDKARYPAMAIVLCQVGIAALAALGMEAATGWKKCLVPLLFGASIFGICAALAALGRVPAGQPSWTMAALAVALAAVLCWRRAAPAAVLALFLVEALAPPLPIQRRSQPGSYLDQLNDQADIAQFLKSQPGWFRFSKDQDDVPYNFGDFHGIEEFSGYLASMPENVFRIVGHPPTPRMFGIQFWVARKPADATQVEVFQSRSGVKVYRNPGIGEPLSSVHNIPCAGADRFNIVSRVPNAFVIDADFACPGLAVAGDPWYPGWRARVDGKRQPVQEFEGVVRAVPVNAGRHRIEFRYRPGSVYWGAALTACGLLLTGLICAFDRRTRGVQPHNPNDSPVAAG
ncbi:conserved membrane hypothetical protein [Candidatus Sulfopaludibacter sp. SbA6]|nr:conserved membrane hypothetical protein [Candidatus Sulfopaludibacter sp. SbA6]